MSTLPSFPPELWSETLKQVRDWKSEEELIYLWTTLRHVSRQFKVEIEHIFRTEHLPKTSLHLYADRRVFQALDNRVHDDTGSKCNPITPGFLGLIGFSAKDPERAVFYVDTSGIAGGMLELLLRNAADIPVNLTSGLATQTGQPTLVSAISAGHAGSVLVQIRGSLSHYALSNKDVDWQKCEISFEWKTLFTRSFREKSRINRILESELASDAGTASSSLVTRPLDRNTTRLAQVFFISFLRPELWAPGLNDFERLQSNWIDCRARIERVERLTRPVENWLATVGFPKNLGDPSITHCRLRQRADRELCLNDDGTLDHDKLRAMMEAHRTQRAVVEQEDFANGTACDSCRMGNTECHSQRLGQRASRMIAGIELAMSFPLLPADVIGNVDFDGFQDSLAMPATQRPCKACVANGLDCRSTLADLYKLMKRSINDPNNEVGLGQLGLQFNRQCATLSSQSNGQNEYAVATGSNVNASLGPQSASSAVGQFLYPYIPFANSGWTDQLSDATIGMVNRAREILSSLTTDGALAFAILNPLDGPCCLDQVDRDRLLASISRTEPDAVDAGLSGPAPGSVEHIDRGHRELSKTLTFLDQRLAHQT